MLNDPEQNMELKKDFNSAICVQKVSISAFKRKHSTTVFTSQTGVSTKPKKSGVGTYAVQNRILYPLTES